MQRVFNFRFGFMAAAAIVFLAGSIFTPKLNAACFDYACVATATPSFDLTLTHSGGAGSYSLSWEEVEGSTDSAIVTYYGYDQFGDTVPVLTSPRFSSENLTRSYSAGVGTRSFIIVSSDNFTGELRRSDVEVHNFIHNLTAEGITRTDGDGTQRGVDQRWTFGFSLDSDAFVTARIYPRTANFTQNAFGFYSTTATVVKTLVESTPRSGELASHSILNTETWDSRSSSGVVVSNDIYFVYISATDIYGTLRGTVLNTVPVDILRIMNLRTTGITATEATGTISYDLTGDANVRVLIAQPGTGFTVDANGDVQPVNRNTGSIDSGLIVSTFTFQRKAGALVETWDGTSSSGTVMPSGVYGIAISATDSYGNHAIDAAGNDAAIFTTMTLERRVSSGSGSTSDTTGPTLSSITPASGATVTGSLSTMTVVLADSQSALNLTGTTILIRDANNSTVTGTVSNNGQDTITVIFATPLNTAGIYTVTVTALDISGNSSTLTSQFTISNSLSSSAFEDSMVLYPNPAKTGNVTVQYSLAVDARVDLEIFTPMGDRIYSVGFNDTQGTNTHTWDRKNTSGEPVGSGLYLVRIKAVSGGDTVKSVKKLVVIR